MAEEPFGDPEIITSAAAQMPFILVVCEGPELRLPAELTSLRASRRAIDNWLAQVGATADDTFVLQHALGELMTNAIEHAFGGELGRDEIALRLRLTADGRVDAAVTDHGRWREPARQTIRGRGLALTSQPARK